LEDSTVRDIYQVMHLAWVSFMGEWQDKSQKEKELKK
jgi:hypothetical protein